MRRILLTLSLAAALAPQAGAQQPAAPVPDVPTPDTLGANFRHDSVGTSTPTDFDFLDGSWTIRFQSRRCNTQEGRFSCSAEFAPARAGTWSARRIHDGQVIEDKFSLINPNDGSRSFTLTYRVYNQARKTWEIAGVNARQGSPWAPGVSWADARGDRYVVQTYGTGQNAFITRIRYYQVKPNHFLWRADGSADGGRTWHRDYWKIEAHRDPNGS
jgi:hypothetical protein